MVKRKLKLKRSVLFILILFVLFLLMLCIPKQKKQTNVIKKDYIESILSFNNEDFNREFLMWIKKNYSDDVLVKLEEKLNSDSYSRDVWHSITGNSYIVLRDLYLQKYDNNSRVKLVEESESGVVSVGYAGDVCLADNWSVMPYYNSRNKGVFGILSEDVVNYMKSMNFMIVNSEFAFSNRGRAMDKKLYTFRAKEENIKIYDEMSVDMVTLANNHVYDYGRDGFMDTLSILTNNNIPYIGAGKNNQEAESAYYLVANGYKIAFLSATRAEKYVLTPEATTDSEGVFRCYDPTRLSQRIKEEREKNDFVVVIVHWGTEDTHVLENVQKETGKLYIDSGADMVIGHHAHVLQGFEFYNGKLIAYNLGNFIFNDKTNDTGILTWKLDSNGKSDFYFLPALQKNAYTSVLENEDSLELYRKINSWSINAKILETGQIIES